MRTWINALNISFENFTVRHFGLRGCDIESQNLRQYICDSLSETHYFVMNPGRFAHFPIRPPGRSPTVPFALSHFAPESFRLLTRSPLSRFAFFPVRPFY